MFVTLVLMSRNHFMNVNKNNMSAGDVKRLETDQIQ